MSPSWRDRVEVFVGARELRLAVSPRGWRARESVRIVRETQDAAADLAAALAESAHRGCDVRIVLSNFHVRYAAVGDAGLLAGAAEREAAGRQVLRSVYGEAADEWRVVMDADSTGVAPVAGAARSLIDGLRHACASVGASRVRIQPLLACAMNGALLALDKDEIGQAGWFGVLEDDRLVLATLDGDRIRAVRGLRVRQDAGGEIAALLQRARLLDADASGRSMLVLASDRTVPLALGPESELRVRTVPLDGTLQNPIGRLDAMEL